MTHAVLCAFARTPFTPAYKGALASVRPDDLMAQLVQGLLKKLPLRTEDIEDMVLGCAFPEAEQGFNMARQVVMLAGLPDSIAGVTLNRFCGSSMEAIHLAAGKIAMGAGELFLVGGVESMSRVPMTGFNPLPNPTLYKTRKEAYMSMGLTAEHVASSCGITRAAQEAFAVESHHKAAAANMQDEIIPITTKAGIVDRDGCIRAESSVDALATLNPAFTQGGTVTAGTSSPLTDGAALVVVASLDYAKRHALPILARIHSHAVAGVAPESMGLGPIAATQKLLQRAKLTTQDIDIAELNEAFAAQALPCIAQLALDATKVNIEGGAIALGHPLGASGARITGKAASLLHRSGKRYALATQCIGGGQGIATLLEKMEA
ncbi:MAG: thiolase family protein [Alphaproteobacteria bacterium]|nr:MAG: thiolase family protein [Alphaproteobacteria bacterium]TAF77169.1 MAG: thiolase family protein [Alphaproteobacteria bacterium]